MEKRKGIIASEVTRQHWKKTNDEQQGLRRSYVKILNVTVNEPKDNTAILNKW